MRILVVHCKYQRRGGEDSVCEAEIQLLRDAGHEVTAYTCDNNEIRISTRMQKLKLASLTTWSYGAHEEIRGLVAGCSPDVAHFHNTFPLISPSAYYACAEAGIPVVQTLHNYRLLCPGATFLRDGKVCEECLGKAVPWPGVVHGCYRGSRSATLATAAMLSAHRAMGTWQNKVNLYIALTEFARKKFIAGGLPANRIVVKSNFAADHPSRRVPGGEYALWVGRLSEEKGILTLIEAWKKLSKRIPLRIVGEGPLKGEAFRRLGAEADSNFELLGPLQPLEVTKLMRNSAFLVYPSHCYETFGMAMIESFACGVPVIASRLGAMAEIVANGQTGLHFNPGDSNDLAAKVEWAWAHPKEMEEMGRAARREYEAKYTAERNYEALMRIYEMARAKGAA